METSVFSRKSAEGLSDLNSFIINIHVPFMSPLTQAIMTRVSHHGKAVIGRYDFVIKHNKQNMQKLQIRKYFSRYDHFSTPVLSFV